MSPAGDAKKIRIATCSLAGCFGCHMSLLDIDERLFGLIKLVEFDRTPLTDIKHCGPCDVGIVEGGCAMQKMYTFSRSSAILVKY